MKMNVTYVLLTLLLGSSGLLSALPRVIINGTELNKLAKKGEDIVWTVDKNASHAAISIKVGTVTLGEVSLLPEVPTNLKNDYRNLVLQTNKSRSFTSRTLTMSSPAIINHGAKLTATGEMFLGTAGGSIELIKCLLIAPKIYFVGKKMDIDCFFEKPELVIFESAEKSALIQAIFIRFMPNSPLPYFITGQFDCETGDTVTPLIIFGASEVRFLFNDAVFN